MKRILLVCLLVTFMVSGSGCRLTDGGPSSPVPDTNEPAETGFDLDSPTGGFSYSDEEPAFGEIEEYEPMTNETAIEDACLEDETVKNIINCKGAKKFRFRAIWGHLANGYRDTTVTNPCPLDWSGTLHLDGGIIIIEKVIAFEPMDYVKRVDRSTIGWISCTGPHVDGIQVRLVVPPGHDVDSLKNSIEPKLILTTGPFSRTFTLEELMALNVMVPVDRCGNGISINSHIIPPHCPHGHLLGVWRRIARDTTDSDTTVAVVDTTETEKKILGVYRGIWISERGHMAGYLKGVFGINSAGEQVFFGKYVNLQGEFKGIIKGEYGRSPDLTADAAHPHGWFHGHWFGRDRIVQGRLKGKWFSNGAGYGYFHGVWGMNCSNRL